MLVKADWTYYDELTDSEHDCEVVIDYDPSSHYVSEVTVSGPPEHICNRAEVMANCSLMRTTFWPDVAYDQLGDL